MRSAGDIDEGVDHMEARAGNAATGGSSRGSSRQPPSTASVECSL